jgi:hypothetical protein
VKTTEKNKTEFLLKKEGEWKKDNERTSDDKYYIDIYNSNLLNETWEKNKIYKIQLRFSNINNISENTVVTESFIEDNKNLFSEWSTVCLIYPILQPELEINRFDKELETIFSSVDNSIVGRVVFKDKESLESYRIKIFKKGQNQPDFDSGDIITNIFNSNEINFTPKYGFLDGEHYRLEVSYITKNLYEGKENFNFMILDPIGKVLEADLLITPENNFGRMKVNLKSSKEYYFGNITIRRTSSRSNFLIWEDVHTFIVDSSGFIDYTWYDYAIESGVWYQYCAQKRSSYGDRGLIVKGFEEKFPSNKSVMTENKESVSIKRQSMVLLDDIFLSGENNQHLKIKFDPQINSFSHTLLDSSTQAIGSKYPFIRRNAEVHYKQFPISGLISYHMDEGNLFVDKEELLDNSVELYKEYNKEQSISEYKDFTLEREFRNRVKDFLYNGKVKLFKSASEGSILVRLMNISLSPKAELGRMIYSFSATAYEIDDFTLENLDKYNIQKKGFLKEVIISNYEEFKEKEFILNENNINENNTYDLFSLLQEEENFSTTNEMVKTIKNLKDLTLNIEGTPYPIKVTSEGYNSSFDKDNKDKSFYLMGYLLKVNNTPFYVDENGFIHINSENDIFINTLSIINPYGNEIKVNLKATLSIEEKEKETTIPQSMNIFRKVSQINENIGQNDNIVKIIFDKHTISNYPDYQKMLAINSFTIETEPYSVFSLRDSFSEEERMFVIGETGILNLTEEYLLESLYFLGKVNSKEYSEDGSIIIDTNIKQVPLLLTYSYELEKGVYKEASEKGGF